MQPQRYEDYYNLTKVCDYSDELCASLRMSAKKVLGLRFVMISSYGTIMAGDIVRIKEDQIKRLTSEKSSDIFVERLDVDGKWHDLSNAPWLYCLAPLPDQKVLKRKPLFDCTHLKRHLKCINSKIDELTVKRDAAQKAKERAESRLDALNTQLNTLKEEKEDTERRVSI